MPVLAFHFGAVLSVIAFALLFGWIGWRWTRVSTDPPGILWTKIVFSTVLLGVGGFCIAFVHPILGVPVGALLAIVASIPWAKNIGNAIASPLANLYDGGTEEEPPKPTYAIAEAHRKQARYGAAITEIRKQLDLFPGDVAGLLMLAEIQCRNLDDWTRAEESIHAIVANTDLAVPTRAKALQALADWHLDFHQDTAAARAAYQRIIDLFPDTPESNDAARRLAHIGDGNWRAERREPSKLVVPKADQRVGLKDSPPVAPPEADPEVEADALRAQLASHPLDIEARESLAILYADRLGRIDWAAAEIEKLLTQPHQAPKHVAKWLHLLADLHVRIDGDEAAARGALERIGALYPGTALESLAQARLQLLRVEFQGRTASSRIGGHPPDPGP
ncbi:MAG: tetratricopeptide repeat protein [Limisphaerales bacterium]